MDRRCGTCQFFDATDDGGAWCHYENERPRVVWMETRPYKVHGVNEKFGHDCQTWQEAVGRPPTRMSPPPEWAWYV